MSNDITNMDDLIDSRDVIGRIEELESEIVDLDELIEAGKEAGEESIWIELDHERTTLTEELAPFKALAESAEGYAPDWEHGETLIRDSYFTEYAEQLADDIGAITETDSWPNNCIDWERAARELQQDYTSVEFDGIAYWIR